MLYGCVSGGGMNEAASEDWRRTSLRWAPQLWEPPSLWPRATVQLPPMVWDVCSQLRVFPRRLQASGRQGPRPPHSAQWHPMRGLGKARQTNILNGSEPDVEMPPYGMLGFEPKRY